MKINLENISSPCVQCYLRGKSYSPDDESCQRCEYYIAIYLLKRILQRNNHCDFCKNKNNLCGECNINSHFVIDWEKTFKEYG